jgi:peptidoglycan-associated lipoprotein
MPEPAPQAAAPQPAPAEIAQPPAPVAPVEPVAQAVKPAEPEGPVASIYFAFDKYDLTEVSRARLAHTLDAANVAGAKVRIEGNCDERGSNEYNLALGQRRADAARNYLVRMGVPADRIQAISYGEERPKMLGHDEESWRENRRADVFVTAPPVVGLVR